LKHTWYNSSMDWKKMVDSVAEGIVYVENFTVKYANPAAVAITGFSLEEITGKKCFEVLRTEICQNECPLRKGEKLPWGREGVSSLDRFNEEKFLNLKINRLGRGWMIVFEDRTREVRLSREVQGNFRFRDIITASPRMLEVLSLLPRVAASSAPVLVEGESGTGKELVSSAIHYLSPRRAGPYLKVNCATIPEGLLESELFGYVRGAFTDARADKKGIFAMAHGGTLLLDEIAEMPLSLQAKLLRVLEEGEFLPLGATSPVKVDVRIIAATNKNLASLVREGRFREDLFYRLNVLYLKLPPLRERKEDIPLLVEHFVEIFNFATGKSVEGLTDRAMELLMDYDYPGNVRELRNIVEAAFVLVRGNLIDVEHLPSYLQGEEAERRRIEDALRRARWKRAEAARILGLSRSTLWRKMKKYGIRA